jgi:hypothetical protein
MRSSSSASQSLSLVIKCNSNATLGWRRNVSAMLIVLAITATSASAQSSAAVQPAQQDEQILSATVKFLVGSALALTMHEGGHLAFDVAFDAHPAVKHVHFGPFPFFAVTHRSDMPPRQEFTISSAGFWVQEATNEWLLTRRPALRDDHAPFAKGMFAFNVLNSIGYAVVAFAQAGPVERDTRGIAAAIGLDEPLIGGVVLAPAILDAYRYYRPHARWAIWASRAVKAGSVLLVIKSR